MKNDAGEKDAWESNYSHGFVAISHILNQSHSLAFDWDLFRILPPHSP